MQLMLTDSDIELVKEYNAHHSSVGLFFDPLYIDVLKEYVSLLDGNVYNTQQISSQLPATEIDFSRGL